jgi:hypothetical protein
MNNLSNDITNNIINKFKVLKEKYQSTNMKYNELINKVFDYIDDFYKNDIYLKVEITDKFDINIIGNDNVIFILRKIKEEKNESN